MPRKQQSVDLSLAGYNDIFQLGSDGEQVIEMPLNELHPPECHPFLVNNDEAMQSLVESIKQYGVREPGLARKRSNGGYELLCGNRRKMACEIASIPTLPVIVRDIDDDRAVIVMVDSNLLQRERILPSEKAYAYRMKMEALNHNGVKGENLSYEIMTAQTGESKNQVYRMIRLTELITVLADMVDTKKLAFNPAVELSYLSIKEQTAVAEAMALYEVKPSLSQAVRFKKLKQNGELTIEIINSILVLIKGGASNVPKHKYHSTVGVCRSAVHHCVRCTNFLNGILRSNTALYALTTILRGMSPLRKSRE